MVETVEDLLKQIQATKRVKVKLLENGIYEFQSDDSFYLIPRSVLEQMVKEQDKPGHLLGLPIKVIDTKGDK